MDHALAYEFSIALAAGLVAQLVAARLAMPSIVLLLATGVLLGPDGAGWFNPGAFAASRSDLVGLAVTVILFEGGLGLDLDRLEQQRRVLLRLLIAGGIASLAAGTLAAHLLLPLPLSIALLYGALMIVTGPTVVTPIMSRLRADRRVRELLISEGVLIDPFGAIIALVLAGWAAGQYALAESGWLAVWRMALGATTGAVAGWALATAIRRRWIPEELENAVVLGGALFIATLSTRLSAEAGLMSAVVQGMVLANSGLRGLRRLREFKESLTIVLLSFVFVLLAADLRLSAIRDLGWHALTVVAVLWLSRVPAVAFATAGSELSWRERAFVAWICPRGIVAASVAGLFAVLLEDAGVPGGRSLEALVFVTVAVTVTIQGLSAQWLARVLGIDVLRERSTLIIGADELARRLARLLLEHGRQTVMLDRSPRHCRIARQAGLPAFEGDALSIDDLEDAGVRYADTVIALTRNPELNELVLLRIADTYRAERLLTLPVGPEDAAAPRSRSTRIFPGNFPGIDRVNELLRSNRLDLRPLPPAPEAIGQPLAQLDWQPDEFAVAIAREDSFLIATGDYVVGPSDRLWLARPALRDRVPEPPDAAPDPVTRAGSRAA